MFDQDFPVLFHVSQSIDKVTQAHMLKVIKI